MSFTRDMPVDLRKLDAPDEYDFVAATDTPLRVFDRAKGRVVEERLRMDGADLSRYTGERGSVVLDNHRREGSEFVCGRAWGLRVEDGKRLAGRVRFTRATEAGRRIADLAAEGTLRTFSIGYDVREQRLTGTSTRGEPSVEAVSWGLNEVSVATVPVDVDAQLRAEVPMLVPDTTPAPSSAGGAPPFGATLPTPAPAAPPTPPSGGAVPPSGGAVGALPAQAVRAAPDAPAAWAAEDAHQRALLLRRCPTALRAWAEERVEGWILEGFDESAVRKLILEHYRASAPVNTPAPTPDPAPAPGAAPGPGAACPGPRDLARVLRAPTLRALEG